MKTRTHQFNDFLSVLAQVLVFWVSTCLPNVVTKKEGYTLVGFNRSGKLAAVLYLIIIGSTAAGYAQTTRYVATTGSNTSNNCSNSAAPCQTISHAISQAAAGDVIEVAAGTYSEVVTIPNNRGNLTLKGANYGINIGAVTTTTRNPETIVLGRFIVGTGASLSGFTLDGFTVDCSGCSAGQRAIYVTATGTISIKNNVIKTGNIANGSGIMNANVGTPFFDISNNQIILGTGITAGIALGGGGTTSLINRNKIEGPRPAILLYSSLLNEQQITNNHITNCSTAIICGNNTGNIIERNIIENNTASGVYLASSNNTIRNNYIQNNGWGVYQENGAGLNNNIVQSNSFSGNTVRNIRNDGVNVTNVIKATCNWYGTTDQTTVTNAIQGLVNYCPWLVNGTDAETGTYGFQPVSGSCTGTDGGLITNTTTGKTFCYIQEGIDDAGTLDGHTLTITQATYTGGADVSAKNLTLSPGSSLSCVTINGNLTLNSGDALDMEINGNTPCTGHDQFIVNGTVALGGATLNLTLGYSMGANDAIVLIQNDDTDPVTGMFAQGTIFVLGGIAYRINYAGGDGNDVVLSRNCADVCPAPITFTGNVTLSTQTQVNNFKNGAGCKYTHITGNLTIDGNGNAGTGTDAAGTDKITDLCNLSELVLVTGNVIVRDFNVSGNPANLNDLAKLATVGNSITIGSTNANDGNSAFATISLPALASVGNNVGIYNNTATTISIPSEFTASPTTTAVTVENNPSLQTLNLGVKTTSGNVSINTNGTAVTAIAMPYLETVGGSLLLINASTHLTQAVLNFNKLKEVNNDMTFTRTASGTISLPDLEKVGSDITISANQGLNTINIPKEFTAPTTSVSITGNTTDALTSITLGVKSTSGNVSINTNGTAVTAIAMPYLETVGGSLLLNNSSSSDLVKATLNFNALKAVLNNMNFRRTTTGNLSMPNLERVDGTIDIDSNDELATVSIPKTFTHPTAALSVDENTGNTLTSVTIGITQITGNLTTEANGNALTSLNYDKLSSVGGFMEMNNTIIANDVSGTANVDLSALTTVAGRLVLVRAVKTLSIGNLTVVGTNSLLSAANRAFTFQRNGITDLDAAFSSFVSVGGNLNVTNNTSLSQCCIIPCRLAIGGTTTINGNTGNCLNLSTAQTNCQITANITGSANVCEMGSVTLNGNPSGSTPPFVHHWSITGGTGGATFINHNNGTATFTGTGVGTVNISYYATGATSCTSNTATFTLTVDAAPGLSACPMPLNIGTSAGGTGDCLGKATFTHPSVLGLAASCSPPVLQVDYNLGGGWQTVTPAGTASVDFPVATTTVNYQLLDVNNNVVSTCSFTVTVSDDEAPTFTCPSPTLVLNTTGNSGCEVTIPDLVAMVTDASDNCSLAAVPVTQSIAAGAYSGVSDGNTIDVVVTVTDAATPANTSTCTVTFTVNDDDAPTLTCPTDQTVTTTSNGTGD